MHPLFEIGQAVVLVKPFKNVGDAEHADVNFPKCGPIYRVRDMRPSLVSNEWFIMLEEVINERGLCPVLGMILEPAFKDTHFAPVEEHSDDALAELLSEVLAGKELVSA